MQPLLKGTEPDRTRQLAEILDLSLAMLDQARAGDWERLLELEARRRDRVAECFREPAAVEEAAAVADALRRILVVNQEITELGEAHRNTLGANLQSFGTARKARKAYAQHP